MGRKRTEALGPVSLRRWPPSSFRQRAASARHRAARDRLGAALNLPADAALVHIGRAAKAFSVKRKRVSLTTNRTIMTLSLALPLP